VSGQYIKRAVRAYKRNILPLVLILLAFYGVSSIIAVPFIILPLNKAFVDGSVSEMLLPIAVGWSLLIVVGSIFYGGVVSAFQASLRGKIGIDAMIPGLKKFFDVALANAVNFLILSVIFLASVVWSSLVLVFAQNEWIVMFSLISLFIILSVPFMFVSHAVVIDNSGPLESVRKSYSAVKKDYFTALGLVTTFVVFVQAFSMIPVIGDGILLFILIPIFGLALTDFYLRKK